MTNEQKLLDQLQMTTPDQSVQQTYQDEELLIEQALLAQAE